MPPPGRRLPRATPARWGVQVGAFASEAAARHAAAGAPRRAPMPAKSAVEAGRPCTAAHHLARRCSTGLQPGGSAPGLRRARPPQAALHPAARPEPARSPAADALRSPAPGRHRRAAVPSLPLRRPGGLRILRRHDHGAAGPGRARPRRTERMSMDGGADARRITIHAPEDFAGMRAAGRLAAETLDMIAAACAPGRHHRRAGPAVPRLHPRPRRDPGAAELSRLSRSRSAPRSTTSSATAFPASGGWRTGDILNIDVTVILDGWHGDSSRDVCRRARRPPRRAT